MALSSESVTQPQLAACVEPRRPSVEPRRPSRGQSHGPCSTLDRDPGPGAGNRGPPGDPAKTEAGPGAGRPGAGTGRGLLAPPAPARRGCYCQLGVKLPMCTVPGLSPLFGLRAVP
jgi:hypothetical protein